MSKPNVLITAIDGHTGCSIAKHITQPSVKKELGEIWGLAEHKICEEFKEQGIKMEQIDTLSSPENMVEIFKHAQTVVLIPSALPNKTKRTSNMFEACQHANVKKVILISAGECDIADKKKCSHLAEFEEIEKAAKPMKFELVTIRANFYTENLLLYKDQLKEGKLPLPTENGTMAPVFLKDVAEAVCTLLIDEEKWKQYSGHVITLTGAELLSGQQMAEHLSQCSGKKVEFQKISMEEAKKILLSTKEIDESEAQFILDFYELVKEGKATACQPQVFEKLTGHSPTTFDDFLKHYKIPLAETAH